MMITPTFPPSGGAHTLRMIKMANELSRDGNEVHVITYEAQEFHPQYDITLNNRVDKEIHIHRIKIGLLHRTVYKQNKDLKSQNNENTQKNVFSNVIHWLNKFVNITGKKIIRKILFPDSMVDWFFSFVNEDRKTHIVLSINPDVIISCSMPSSVHIIGYKISRKYNIPLVVDYADPWVYHTKYKKTIRSYLERNLEKKILMRACLASFSAEGCRKVYCNKYCLPENKTITVMSGYEDRLLSDARKIRKTKEKNLLNNRIELVYGGAIQPGVRDVTPLLQALKEINDDRFRLLIRTDIPHNTQIEVERFELTKTVIVDQYITFAEHLSELVLCDAVVLLGNSNNIQIPSKLFTYIAIGTPIIYLTALSNEEEDDVKKIITESNVGMVIRNQKNEIIEALNTIMEKKQKDRIQSNAAINFFSEKSQFDILNNKINQMVKIK